MPRAARPGGAGRPGPGHILQETFLAAVRSLDSFEMREEASLIDWLSRLAERQIIAAADYPGARKRDNRHNVTLSVRSATRRA